MSQQSDERQTRQRDDGESQESDPSRVEDDSPPRTQGSAPGPGRDDAEGADEETTRELPLDQVFEILKNSRRRETLQYLRDNGGEATLSDVAEHIAAIENDTTVQAISSTQRKRVYVGLYQCHLPKMDDMDVVDFDKNRGTIELKPAAQQLYTYLEDEESRDWYKVYLAIAGVGAVLFALAFGGASSILTPPVVLAGLLVGVTACGIAQAMEESD